MNEQIRKLRQQIADLKTASMLNAKEIADRALSTAMQIFESHESRLQRLEELYKNVEVLRDGKNR